MTSIPLIPAEDVTSMSIWINIVKSYRYEMEPSKKQEVKCLRTLEVCRHVHNWSYGERKEAWKNGGWRVTYKDQQDHLTRLRHGLDKENEELGKELNEIYAQIAQNQVHRVDLAYDRFFERNKDNKANPKKYKKPGHPRAKGMNRMKSFTFPQFGNGCHIVDKYGNKDLKGDFIELSKIGTIPFVRHIEMGDPGIPYLVKTITIKKEVDKWIFIPVIETFAEIDVKTAKAVIPIYVYIEDKEFGDTNKYINKEIKTVEELQKELDIINKKCVGNDMGLPKLIIDSNGRKVEAPKYLEKSAKRLRKEQQKLSRKKMYDVIDESTAKVKRDPNTNKKIWKGSKNRDKQVDKVAKVHIHIAYQRRNSNHIISKRKVKDNELNVCEKLDIQRMMKNRRYSKRIADSGWSQVQRFMTYKAAWAGKMVDFVDPANTSQSCSRCGTKIGRTQNTANCCQGDIFRCPICKLETNVHIGAGKNIRNRSPIYQQKLDDIYRRLSPGMKGLIDNSAKKLRDNIYCWSLDPEDSWPDDPSKIIGRDAAARIYAFGEVTSTRLETVEQVISRNKEAAPKGGYDTSYEQLKLSKDLRCKPPPLGGGS